MDGRSTIRKGREAARTRVGRPDPRMLAAHPVARLAAAFAAGLVLGWMVLGWWIAPVKWVDALPADLMAPERETYVQMVADLYVRDDRLQLAAERLASFRDVGDDTRLAELFGRLTEPGRDATASENVRQLAAALGVAPRAPSDAAAATPGPGRSGGWLGEVGRVAAGGVLLLAAAAGAYLARTWAGGAAARAGRAEAPTAAPERGDEASTALYADRPPGYAPRAPHIEHTQPLSVAEGGRGRELSSPQWRPGRIDLGTTREAAFEGADEPFYQTWLVYDERASLIGSAALKAVRVGSVTTLDVWFYERDESSDVVARPTITIVSRAAAREPVLRARLGDRRLLEAVPGARAALAAGDLELAIEIRDVAPDPAADELSLTGVRLGMTARRVVQPTRDDEPEPPVPLPFQR